MPAKSPAQERLMQAAAHTKGGFGGVPQSVGKEFVGASPKPGASPKSRDEHIAQRRGAGLSHRAVGSEFGVGKSTIHRKTGNMAKQGYSKMGPAR